MFSKLCVLAVAIPFISALTLDTPMGPKNAAGQTLPITSSGPITLNWQATRDDPAVFSLELANEGFHDTFAVANNVPIDAQTITLTLPSVPVNQEYTIQAVDISNVTHVYAVTGPFTIGEAPTSSEASSSTSKSSGNSSGSSGPSISAMPPVSTSSFGVTRPNTVTGTNTSPTNSASSSGANAPTGTNFGNSGSNSGLPVRLNVNKGFIASAALSLVAGAAIVAL